MAQVKRQIEQWVVEDRERRHQAAFALGWIRGFTRGRAMATIQEIAEEIGEGIAQVIAQGRTQGTAEEEIDEIVEKMAEEMRMLLAFLLKFRFGVQSKGTYLAILNQMQGVEQMLQLSRWAMDCATLEELMRKIDRDKN